MGVTGVTAEGKTYAKNSYWQLLLHPLSIRDWVARGSYGADLQRYASLGIQVEGPDPSQVLRNGFLRPWPIAAYSPNIPWAVATSKPGETNWVVDMDGAGTSAATPQVAAAAALWLEKNYDQIAQANAWSGSNAWKKVEAVYCALLLSAERKQTNADKYLGAGTLKARYALDHSFNEIASRVNLSKRFDDYPTIAPNEQVHDLGFSKVSHDYFDGQRSLHQILLPIRQKTPALRAQLRQNLSSFSTRGQALCSLVYNELLLEQIEGFSNPSSLDAGKLDEQARKLMKNAVEHSMKSLPRQ